MKLINDSDHYKGKHKRRFELTIEFMERLDLKSFSVLDLGPSNPMGKLMKEHGYNVTNTPENMDLDTDFQIVKNPDFQVITAFEILEHMVSPFPMLKDAAAAHLVATVPLRLWFSPAYWNNNDPYDCHYHEFEPLQFKMLLEKAGWNTIKQEMHTSPIKKLGIRPFLRLFTPRYLFVYARRARS